MTTGSPSLGHAAVPTTVHPYHIIPAYTISTDIFTRHLNSVHNTYGTRLFPPSLNTHGAHGWLSSKLNIGKEGWRSRSKTNFCCFTDRKTTAVRTAVHFFFLLLLYHNTAKRSFKLYDMNRYQSTTQQTTKCRLHRSCIPYSTTNTNEYFVLYFRIIMYARQTHNPAFLSFPDRLPPSNHAAWWGPRHEDHHENTTPPLLMCAGRPCRPSLDFNFSRSLEQHPLTQPPIIVRPALLTYSNVRLLLNSM